MQIIYEDNHLLALDKPSGLPSQPDSSGDQSLVDLAKAWLKKTYAKPGDVYLALLHRLDRPTSGLVLTAKTGKAASRMADQFRRRAVDKQYLAVVACRRQPPAAAELTDRLAEKDNGSMRIAAGDSGKQAKLSYQTLAYAGKTGQALLLVTLDTGLKHQIRVQLAARNMPVIGDFRYGPGGAPARPQPVLDGRAILLHACSLDFDHPVGKGRIALTAPPPPHWSPYLAGFDALDHPEIKRWLTPAQGEHPWL